MMHSTSLPASAASVDTPRVVRIIKLGGSCITDKRHYETLQPSVIQALAQSLALPAAITVTPINPNPAAIAAAAARAARARASSTASGGSASGAGHSSGGGAGGGGGGGGGGGASGAGSVNSSPPSPPTPSTPSTVRITKCSHTILIHGAGSFGHFTAREFALAKGFAPFETNPDFNPALKSPAATAATPPSAAGSPAITPSTPPPAPKAVVSVSKSKKKRERAKLKAKSAAAILSTATAPTAAALATAAAAIAGDAKSDSKSTAAASIASGTVSGGATASTAGAGAGAGAVVDPRVAYSLERQRRAMGLCILRRSLLRLHTHILEALHSAGIPAVGVSPFDFVSSTSLGVTIVNFVGLVSRINALLSAGYVPVLHGDMVLDETMNWSVLSGDRILTALCTLYRPKIAVFATNVDGVLDGNSKLIQTIAVDPETGTYAEPPKLSAAAAAPQLTAASGTDAKSTAAAPSSGGGADVSGGMSGKLRSCADVACDVPECTTVAIVRAGTVHCDHVITGSNDADHTRGWIGTLVTCEHHSPPLTIEVDSDDSKH